MPSLRQKHSIKGAHGVSICESGMQSKVRTGKISVEITEDHPLISLALILPWAEFYEIIICDLKQGFWWMGRKLKVRIHLGAFILQQLYNLTDRQIEYGIKDNAAYRSFCGFGIVKNWHAPDHTSIEKFRSRLSPETQRLLANKAAQHAAKIGIADPKDVDIDSTVQEANMTYPTDAKMLRKLGILASKVSDSLKSAFPKKDDFPKVDLKKIALKARNCFFQDRHADSEEKSKRLEQLWRAVSQPVKKTIQACNQFSQKELEQLKWNIKYSVNQLVSHGTDYLRESKVFIKTGKATSAKKLSFHLDDVECFSKGKAHKKHEFGRAFQLGRIGGNFLFVAACTNVRMDDKKSLMPIIDEHENLFGSGKIDTLSTDKCYYSKKNVKHAMTKGVEKVGIQVPNSVIDDNSQLSPTDQEVLYNRRSGIEPLIGHAKHGGQLGRSRMKKDETIKASGYASILGFNLRQTIRAQKNREEKLLA